MTIATPLLGFAVLVCVIVVAYVASRIIPPGGYQSSGMYVFMTVLSGLAVLITFFFYYSVVELNQRQQELSVVHEAEKLNDTAIVGLMTVISHYLDYIPGFIGSIYPLSDISGIDKEGNTSKLGILQISNRMFSIWQDTVLIDNFIAIENRAYITHYLQWANSGRLYKQWKIAKINYNKTTQIFGDMLFEYALPITNQTPEMYNATAVRFLNDPRASVILPSL